jgi:outer membrane scaffolding protein for murein synthesis (MipA/OmpV family)
LKHLFAAAALAVAALIAATCEAAENGGSTAAAPDTKALFEIGVAGGTGWIPDYPAAGQNHVQGLALPYVIYRGQVLQSDETGVRGKLYRSRTVEFDLSLGGALRASSRDNRAREGMPDLDYLGEIGPSVRVHAYRDPVAGSIDLELPVRSAFSTNFSRIDYRGFVFAPELSYTLPNLGFEDSRWKTSIGPIFATSRLMDYFYQVDPRFARPDRPAFEAHGGYLGTRLQSYYKVPINGRLSVFAAGRVETFAGATNQDSPLFKREVNFSVGAGLTFSLYRSDARSEVPIDAVDFP